MKRRTPFRGVAPLRARERLDDARYHRLLVIRLRSHAYSADFALNLRYRMEGNCCCWRVTDYFPTPRQRLLRPKRLNLARDRLLGDDDIPF